VGLIRRSEEVAVTHLLSYEIARYGLQMQKNPCCQTACTYPRQIADAATPAQFAQFPNWKIQLLPLRQFRIAQTY